MAPSRTATEESDADRRSARGDRHGGDPERPSTGTAEWFAASTLRIVLAVVGLVVLLFGLGMAMGIDILGAIVTVLETEVARWLLVALFGLFILFVAVRGFNGFYGE
jgi:hypothetical protein